MNDIQQKWPQMQITPVGQVSSEIKTPSLHAGESGLEFQGQKTQMRENQKRIREMVSEIVIFPKWEALLDGVDGFSHILVLYWPHLIDPERRNLQKVHPMGRKDLPKQGIFATCSPARPNPVLITAVRLLERKDNILKVQGLEAVDGSPIVDIKPYVQGYYRIEDPIVADWMAQIQRELALKAQSEASDAESQ